MEMKKVCANGYRVITSGTVIGFKELPEFTFELAHPGGFSFRLKLVFEQKNGEGSSVTTDVDEKNISMRCVNFDNTLGAGFSKPIEIATVGGKKVFFKFVAHDMQRLPMLNYTFYQEQAVE